ncbi:MAG: 30S ribosomal protein S6 [Alphaproteobacteria bacterium]|nr:30S ribosomal protein S6 [Alphaproteobacteria bacterium]MBT5860861.1 30S ribosomal protein S6 [Alphaproteobacteria bacterium]
MPYYESVFLVRADVSSQQVEALAKSFTDIIADNGGAVTKTEHWGLRTLAYRIKKNRKAHYVMFNIDSPAPAVLEMERNMALNEDVLRTLTLRVDELEEEPSAIMASKGRDDRGRRDRGPRSDGPPPATAAKTDAKEAAPTAAAADVKEAPPAAAPAAADTKEDAKDAAPAAAKTDAAAPEQSDDSAAASDTAEGASDTAPATPAEGEDK